MQVATTDICVVGAGIAGREVAAIACESGAHTLLIDPSIRHTYPSAGLPISELKEHSSFTTSELQYASELQRNRSLEFTVSPYREVSPNGRSLITIQGVARFTDPATVEAAGILIRPNRFVLAVGSRPFLPMIPELNAIPYYTTETIHQRWRSLTNVVVVGGGPSGVELSQDIKRTGAHVTLVTAGSLLSSEDRDATDLIRASLERQGIKLLEHCGLRHLQRTESGLRLYLYTDAGYIEIECADVVFATGRRPALEALNLEAGNIREGMKGIIVDDMLRTTNPRCYAAGDCIGSPMSSHGALYHARLVADYILRSSNRRFCQSRVPRVVYGQIELAQLGDTEESARRPFPGVRVMRARFEEGSAAGSDRTDGLIKVMIANRKAIGVTIASPRASEAIAPWCVAFDSDMEVTRWQDIVMPSSLAAKFSRAAMNLRSSGTDRFGLVDKILAVLRKVG